jgi:hypothetical protein
VAHRVLRSSVPPISRRAWLLSSTVGAAALVQASGCAPKTAAMAPVGAGPRPLHLSPLADLAPAAGLRFLLVANVGALVQPAALGKALSDLASADRLDALADLLGFDPRLADEAVLADYGASTLFLFRVAHDPEVVERRFRERVPGQVVRIVHEPRIVRITGVVGKTPRSLVFLDERVIALEVGGEGYARAVVGFATEKLHRAHPALSVEPLQTLAAALGKQPLQLYLPSPAKEPWSVGAHGLLEVTSAVGLAARPTDEGLFVELLATGQYGDAASPVRARLEATVRDVVTSPLGSLTGVVEPRAAYTYDVTPERLRVTTTWDAARIAKGLRNATSASIAEIVSK